MIITFNHYPIVSDGYVHSMQLNEEFCINASVEAIGYRPVKLGEILNQWYSHADSL